MSAFAQRREFGVREIMRELAGKTAFVTGGASGIGLDAGRLVGSRRPPAIS
jgi:hypothetical protein